MSFLSNVLSSRRSPARPGVRQPKRSAAPGLTLERLEERWVPAITITGLESDSVVIADSSSGKTNNSIVIIDDVDTQTTYIKINNGSAQQLGLSGTLLTNLTVRMGTGKDKVSFVTSGSGLLVLDNALRQIDLGSGNDSLSISRTAGLGGGLTYRLIGDTSGNDSYRVSGDHSYGSFTFDAATTHEYSGNDKYRFDFESGYTNVSIAIYDDAGKDSYVGRFDIGYSNATTDITDLRGNDSYNWTFGGSFLGGSTTINDQAGSDKYVITTTAITHTTPISFVVNDIGSGKNSLAYNQTELTTYATIGATFNFTGDARNKASFGGDGDWGFLANSSITYNGGSHADVVKVDDLTYGLSSTAHFSINTGAGEDKLSIKLDGVANTTGATMESFSNFIFFYNLGDHDDVLNVAINGSRFTTDASATPFINGSLGAGDDKAYVKVKKSPLALTGASTNFGLYIFGSAGDDLIDVNLGRFGGSMINYGIYLTGDAGADTIKISGVMENALTNRLGVYLSPGAEDGERDVIKSTLRVGEPTLPTDLTFSLYGAGAEDKVSLATGANAPTWDVTP